MSVGIYKITSPSGKVYIGQTTNVRKRMREYKSTLAFNQPALGCSFAKYGFFEHKIELIHELPKDVSVEILDNYEILYMQAYRDCGIVLLNIKEGGSCGRHSEETKRKIGMLNKGKYIGVKRNVTEEHRRNLSIALLGKRKSKAHVEKMKINGRKHRQTEEEKNANRKRWLGEKNPNAKQVICTNSGVVYNTIAEAAVSIGINCGTLADYLRGDYPNKTSLIYLNG